MYGSYLHDGLGAIPGARYAGESLRIPKPMPFTGTAQGGTIRALYGESPKIPQLLFGRTPLWEVEGHQVDQFYDVRGNDGLGQVAAAYESPAPSGRWGDAGSSVKSKVLNGSGPGAKLQTIASPSSGPIANAAAIPAAVGDFFSSPLFLVALAAGAFYFFKRAK